jgi:hypothetical protein
MGSPGTACRIPLFCFRREGCRCFLFVLSPSTHHRSGAGDVISSPRCLTLKTVSYGWALPSRSSMDSRRAWSTATPGAWELVACRWRRLRLRFAVSCIHARSPASRKTDRVYEDGTGTRISPRSGHYRGRAGRMPGWRRQRCGLGRFLLTDLLGQSPRIRASKTRMASRWAVRRSKPVAN